VWVLPQFGDRKPMPFLTAPSDERKPRFSPDGRFVAYAANEAGRYEVFVESFPEHHDKWQVSNQGGFEPRWRPDGKELFFLQPDGSFMAADIA
jgi:Tol biopolymer transport system component